MIILHIFKNKMNLKYGKSQRKRRKYWDYGSTFNSKGFSVYLFSGLANQTPNLTQRLWDGCLWVAKRIKILPVSGFLRFCGFEQDPYCYLDLGFVVNI